MSANKYTALEIKEDDWEGIRVEGAIWTPVKNFSAAR
jgi:hypothetical protein